MTTLYTIGFTKKDAETFFELLIKNKVHKIIDVRLNNASQLAGFTKKNDFTYFLKKICNISYFHFDLLAPTKEILDSYKKHQIEWEEYEKKYLNLLKIRQIESRFINFNFDGGCLLCSEPEPNHCHRRLAAKYLKEHYPINRIIHL